MQHLNLTQRNTIFNLLQNGHTQVFIAQAIGVSQAAICKELKRNRNKNGKYNPAAAQVYADERKERLAKKRKLTPTMEKYIRGKITTEQWSPEQIAGEARLRQVSMIGKTRIYKLIHDDKKAGGALWTHCRWKLKHRKRTLTAGVKHIPNRVDIDQRPPEVDSRQNFGHWEMDLIESADKRTYLLTLIERMSRYLIIEKLPNGKNANDVSHTAWRALLPYKNAVESITTDNGGEFANHCYLCKQLKTTVYFAKPYCSWQKGAIENANGLIRQYLPKGTNFNNLNDNDLKQIQYKINLRPRQTINFKKPNSLFFSMAKII
jgi:IS30 family transposase